jgi:hypothetical protein
VLNFYLPRKHEERRLLQDKKPQDETEPAFSLLLSLKVTLDISTLCTLTLTLQREITQVVMRVYLRPASLLFTTLHPAAPSKADRQLTPAHTSS